MIFPYRSPHAPDLLVVREVEIPSGHKSSHANAPGFANADAPRFVDANAPGIGPIPDVVRSCATNSASILLSWHPCFRPLGGSLPVGDGIGHLWVPI